MTAPRRLLSDEARAAVLLHAVRPLSSVKPNTSGRYLVKGLLDRGALSAVYGAPNVGKTFFALDLALHVTAGESFFGRKVMQEAGPAIYVIAEGHAAFGNRVEAIRRANPGLAQRSGRMAVLPVALNLCKGEDAALLCDLVEERAEAAPALIVIDTLARSLGAGDENSGTDMSALVASAALLQDRTGAHVMLVHHTGKDAGRGMRGHSALHAALDTEIELSRPDPAGRVVSAVARKQRDLEVGEPFYFTLRRVQIGTDEDGDPVTSAVIEEAAAPETSRGALAQNEERKSAAAGRADAALRLLPRSVGFSVADAAPLLIEAGVIKTDNRKSGIEMVRRMLRKMTEAGSLSALADGKFMVAGRVE